MWTTCHLALLMLALHPRAHSEIDATAKRFLETCHRAPQMRLGYFVTSLPIYLRSSTDIFDANYSSFRRKVLVYASGFPCTPYSALHCHSKLLEDPAARPLYKVVQNIKDCAPVATWPV